MKKYIRNASEINKEELRDKFNKILKDAWTYGGSQSAKKRTIDDYMNSDYSSLSSYVKEHRDQIFPIDFVEEKIWDYAHKQKNPEDVEQEMLKIWDHYTEHDFIQNLDLDKDDTKKNVQSYVMCTTESYQLYRNKRNENKYIEVKKTSDGHTWFRQFMYWNTPEGSVKNYSASKTNRGRYHRVRQDTLNMILEDYEPVDDVHIEEDVFESKKITASWPEELTYEEYPEGDQIIEVFIDVVDDLGLFEEPSGQGGMGTDFFYDEEGNEVGRIDLQKEAEQLENLYWDSKSKRDFRQKVTKWMKGICKLDQEVLESKKIEAAKDANKEKYVVYAEGTISRDGRGFFWMREAGGRWTTESEADVFNNEEANRLCRMKGKYTWVKKKVT